MGLGLGAEAVSSAAKGNALQAARAARMAKRISCPSS
jgi:hypothetical protein